MARYLLSLIWVSCLTINFLTAQSDSTVQLNLEPFGPQTQRFDIQDYELRVEGKTAYFSTQSGNGLGQLFINGEAQDMIFNNGRSDFQGDISRKGNLYLIQNGKDTRLYHLARRNDNSLRVRKIPLWLSVLPPLIAIGLALLFKEVVVSLFVGIWAGAFIAGGLRIESLYYMILSVFEVVSNYIVNALSDGGHMSIIVFSMLIGGMVAIISRNGGMAGIVKSLAKYARSPRSTQFVTWLLGVAIFFDDYANTLIVGNTMRSVTDKFKISREKLAYIVDSTAAPVAAIAFVTTWIGAELSYIDEGLSQLSGPISEMTPYAVFIESLKYSFYPILTLLFILFIIYTKRDFGPMYKAELRARTTGQVSPIRSSHNENTDTEDLSPIEGAPLKGFNAVVPVVTVILVTLFGLLDTGFASTFSELVDANQAPSSDGWGQVWSAMAAVTDGNGFFVKMGKIIGNSDSYVALLYASFAGVFIALIMTIGQKIMSLEKTIGTMTTGFKTMLPAVLILTLAWSLAATTEQLHTATYLTGAIQDSIAPQLLPPIIFVLAAFVSFATGSSWSTMAILYPIAIPTTWAVCQSQGLDAGHSTELLFNVISIVLGASVLGDHCSPISDTTILSSLASDCNHIDHVRTQLPYAVTVGVVSIIMVTLSGFIGGSWLLNFLLLLIGAGALFGIVKYVGKPVAD